MSDDRLRVLFICTGNSARSQMAETVLRQLSHGRIDVVSAGTAPQPDIHPMARQAIRNLLHIEMIGQYPKSMQRFLRDHFDYIISVCERADQSCPVFPDDPERIRWSFDDPAAVEGSDAEKQRAFDTVARQLVGRIRIWMCLPRIGAACDRVADLRV
jgi:ArsR family transcriptional regulator, arsenate/arsenite/antimonite-responsive transcriptional repressor / arsenate reductase (thioredoxin)